MIQFYRNTTSRFTASLLIFISLTLFSLENLNSQVIIGPTTGSEDTPKALLDVRASNVSSPTNIDGFLLPRLTAFPDADVLTEGIQEGTMIIYLPEGTPEEGRVPGGVYVYSELEAWELLALSGDGIDDDGDAPCTPATLCETSFENESGCWSRSEFSYSDFRSYDGQRSVRSSSNGNLTLNNIDFSPYTSIDISFYYYLYSYDGNEDLVLEYSLDGWSWTELDTYNIQYSWNNANYTITDSALMRSNLQIRIRADVNGNGGRYGDVTYIDLAVITGGCD